MSNIIKDILRSLRLTYVLNNVIQRRRLHQNIRMYKKYGIAKKYFSSVAAKDFEHLSIPDITANKNSLENNLHFKNLDHNSKTSLIDFSKNGFSVLPNFFPLEQINQVNEDVEEKLQAGTISFRYGNRKLMFSHKHIKSVRNLALDDRLTSILTCLLNASPTLFQSISFPRKGSEQSVHTDNIHLSTFPRAGMVGVWIAMEPIDHDNGPISYYPGSHTLPYITNSDYNNEGSSFFIGDKPYLEYEKLAKKVIQNSTCKKKIFHANPGDVLIWHSNLFHAGEPHLDNTRTRKSTVFHYLSNECIWYHELTQRPTLL